MRYLRKHMHLTAEVLNCDMSHWWWMLGETALHSRARDQTAHPCPEGDTPQSRGQKLLHLGRCQTLPNNLAALLCPLSYLIL